MGRFTTFLAGFLLGGCAMFGAMNYHIVRTEEGVQFVPKVTASLYGTYVDIRGFEVDDWNEHLGLAAALIKANKGHLLGESVELQVRHSLDQAWQGLMDQAP